MLVYLFFDLYPPFGCVLPGSMLFFTFASEPGCLSPAGCAHPSMAELSHAPDVGSPRGFSAPHPAQRCDPSPDHRMTAPASAPTRGVGGVEGEPGSNPPTQKSGQCRMESTRCGGGSTPITALPDVEQPQNNAVDHGQPPGNTSPMGHMCHVSRGSQGESRRRNRPAVGTPRSSPVQMLRRSSALGGGLWAPVTMSFSRTRWSRPHLDHPAVRLRGQRSNPGIPNLYCQQSTPQSP